jgi:hypothetical protein
MIPDDIFDEPARRSTKVIGHSVMRQPAWAAAQVSSTWNA